MLLVVIEAHSLISLDVHGRHVYLSSNRQL
jgi:hypothetical protein